MSSPHPPCHSIGTSALLAAWNAATYVAQVRNCLRDNVFAGWANMPNCETSFMPDTPQPIPGTRNPTFNQCLNFTLQQTQTLTTSALCLVEHFNDSYGDLNVLGLYRVVSVCLTQPLFD